MSRFNLQSETRCSITLHVCPDVAMFRQCGMWYDTDRVYQFVPCHDHGLVVATLKNNPAGSAVLCGWVIYRPKALELVWPNAQDVNLVEINRDIMLEWYHQTRERWVYLGTPMRNPLEHLIPR